MTQSEIQSEAAATVALQSVRTNLRILQMAEACLWSAMNTASMVGADFGHLEQIVGTERMNRWATEPTTAMDRWLSEHHPTV